jgi:dienelactone hydrolase
LRVVPDGTHDDLHDFERATATYDGRARPVYRTGSGPAVIVLAEIPGITPKVAGFARRVAAEGFTAVMPHLFGTPGAPMSMGSLPAVARTCISREFAAFSRGAHAPVTDWLRALARDEHQRCGGPGVGVVGMCFTGNFALAMATDPAVLAPVMAEPSLPLGMTARSKADPHLSPDDVAAIQARVRDENLCVIGLRFTGDRIAPAERFETFRRLLGDNFVGVELDSSPGNPGGHRKGAHSVLTEDLVDEPGSPTRDALDQVLQLFRDRLLPPAG